MKSIFFVFLIVLSEYCYAQNISGTVQSAGAPIQSASVSVVSKNNLSFKTSTDIKGEFFLRNVPSGTCSIKITCIGYNSIDTTLILKDSSKIAFVLAPSFTRLDSVTIRSNKNRIEKSIDRIIYRVSGVSVYQNKSVADILKNIPRLNVTRSGIEIRGAGPAGVMIDSHLIYLTSKDLLDYLNIYKDDIENVEIIPNPPAKYDAQGSGLINIVTKRRKNPGLFGYVETAVTKNSYWESDETFSLSFRNKNLSISGSAGNSVGAYRENVSNRTDFFNSLLTSYDDESNNKDHLNNNRISLVAELLLNTKSKIYTSYSLVTNNGHADQNHLLNYFKGGISDSTWIYR